MKTRALLQITLIYIVIGVAGYAAYIFFFDQPSILRLLYADLVMTVISYVFSLIKKNSSVYDAYWSVIPFYFLVFWYIEFGGADWTWLQWLAFAAVSFWSWRLTLSWARGWSGFGQEDWRYVDFRNKFGKHFEWVNFSAIHLFPTVIVFLASLPLFWTYEYSTEAYSSPMVIAGVGIAFLGGVFELLGDNALAKFRKRDNPKQGEILESGIWGLTRNPNYLGEMLFWVGCFFIGHGYGAPWWTCFGCIAMISMFTFVSIPLKEKRMLKRRDNFQDYQRRVSVLIPWFPKK